MKTPQQNLIESLAPSNIGNMMKSTYPDSHFKPSDLVKELGKTEETENPYDDRPYPDDPEFQGKHID